MDGFDIVIVMLAVIWVAAGQVGPWIVMRSKGIRLSFLEYSSPLIKKSIFAIDHNIIVFDALQMIQSNNLDISIRELEEMYNANMDFNESSMCCCWQGIGMLTYQKRSCGNSLTLRKT